jgi:serine/threonine protein kinase/formylglycine-generating enzyme required for sulfatase activity
VKPHLIVMAKMAENTSQTPTKQWRPPKSFDGYRLLWILSASPKGWLYAGRDTLLDRPVAVRFIEFAAHETAGRQLFLDEARASARVHHPNVATIYRVGEIAGRPYVVSEFIRGQSLAAVSGPLPWREVLDYALRIVRGLAAAHRNNVVHRDIKPSNIIISTDGELKLLDLGLGSFIEGPTVPSEIAAAAITEGPAGESSSDDGIPSLPPDSDLLPAATGSGRPYDLRYRAPEVRGGAPCSERGDVYSVGMVLHDLLCGYPPDTTSDSPEQEPKSLSFVRNDIDPRLAAVVERCMMQRPEERFASADELRAALEQLFPATGANSLPDGNPYRGLLAFEVEHRGLFFGRRSEIGTVLERLRTEACVLVAAESGVGKSSLCRAGVLPLVQDGALGSGRSWKSALMMPGRHPLRTLAGVLAETLGADERKIEVKLEASPSSISREISRLVGERGGLVLFIDQLEELVTLSDKQEANIVGEALGELLTRTPSVRLLMTARSDFLGRVAMVPGIGDAVTRALYILRPLGPDRLREVVIGPAQAKGVMFESPALVTSLVESSAHTDGGLPLLQFALTELWDARVGNQITARALDAIGGVTGALARHADQVVGSLPPQLRTTARRVLMALVTLDGTRASRTEEELTAGQADVAPVLEALVKGRLLVARDTPYGTAYEVAHESLIKGWNTLQTWLEQFAEARAVRQRLETAAAEWRRLGKPQEALWTARQLAETALLEPEEIGPREREFISICQKVARRRQRIRNLILVAIPLGLFGVYGVAQYQAKRELGQRMNRDIVHGSEELSAARAKDLEVEGLYTRAYTLCDNQKLAECESTFAKAQELALEADRAFSGASQFFEAVVTTDHTNIQARELLGDTLYERALMAERDRRTQQLEDLLQRLALYDSAESRRTRWNAPGHIRISTTPASRVMLKRYERDPKHRRALKDAKDLGVTPIADAALAPGSYLMTLSAPGHVDVQYPFVVTRGAAQTIDVPLPLTSEVPSGFVFIPAGTFMFGSGTEEAMRKSFLSTVPIHPVKTDAYLIARNETTYGEWIEYLNALPPAERAQQIVPGKGGITGTVALKQLADGTWQIELKPVTQLLIAKAGEPIVYGARTMRKQQNWLRMPVGGVSFAQAGQYAQWLDSSGKQPGAQLCDEYQWERAARGADDREWPHGDELGPQEANHDVTYDKDQSAMGPDEVGSYPQSRSPFGLDDMAGNVFEWTYSKLSKDEPIMRSGSYFFSAVAQRSTNRNALDRNFRDPNVGLRICVPYKVSAK